MDLKLEFTIPLLKIIQLKKDKTTLDERSYDNSQVNL
jgi:hypothetical protein